MTVMVALYVTDDLDESLVLTFWTQLLSFIMYYFHERAWSKIDWETK